MGIDGGALCFMWLFFSIDTATAQARNPGDLIDSPHFDATAYAKV
jgi:hypothetical protein